MTECRVCVCRVFVQIYRTNGQWYSAEYSTFSISDEAGQYRLTVNGYSGDAGNALMVTGHPNWVANGRTFSTSGGCAWDGGWWYGMCSRSEINRNGGAGGAVWVTSGATRNVIATRMLVKLD